MSHYVYVPPSPSMYGCEATHWNVGNQPAGTPSEKRESLSHRCQLPIAPHLVVMPREYLLHLYQSLG